MNLKTAKTLKQGTTIYHTTLKNADGTPMRARVTSVKTWKRSPERVEIRYKRGLYEYGTISEHELKLFTTIEPGTRKYSAYKSNGQIVVTNNRTGKQRRYAPQNFIYGQRHYIAEAYRLPGYIHNIVWEE